MRSRMWWGVTAAGWLTAVILFVVFAILRTPSHPGPSSYAPDSDDGGQRRVRLVNVHTIDEFGAAVGQALGRPVHLLRNQLGTVERCYLEFGVPELDIAGAFRLLNAQATVNAVQVSWRSFPTHVEIGERTYFDGQERSRRTYDLSGLIRTLGDGAGDPYVRENRIKKIVDLIETGPSMEDWVDNGGELASIQILGMSLIITAPERMHKQIAAVLAEARAAAWSTGFERGLRTGMGGGPVGGGGGQSPFLSPYQ